MGSGSARLGLGAAAGGLEVRARLGRPSRLRGKPVHASHLLHQLLALRLKLRGGSRGPGLRPMSRDLGSGVVEISNAEGGGLGGDRYVGDPSE